MSLNRREKNQERKTMTDSSIKRGSRSTVMVAVVAILALSLGIYIFGGTNRNPQEVGAGVLFAGTSVKCGDDIANITTGNASGNCKSSVGESGKVDSATCADDKGNSASFSCSGGGCFGTSGSGNCGYQKKD
jgi:hypothetical protein